MEFQQGFDGRQYSKAHLHPVQDTPLFLAKETSALLNAAGRNGWITKSTQHGPLAHTNARTHAAIPSPSLNPKCTWTIAIDLASLGTRSRAGGMLWVTRSCLGRDAPILTQLHQAEQQVVCRCRALLVLCPHTSTTSSAVLEAARMLRACLHQQQMHAKDFEQLGRKQNLPHCLGQSHRQDC